MPKRTCSFPGCDGPYEAKGLCNKHYLRLRRKGNPADPGKKGPYFKPVEPRLWSRINKQGPVPPARPSLGPCWQWLGARTGAQTGSGYGEINVQGRHHLVHRLVYQMLVGSIPNGLTLDHLCRNTSCCNPSHLEVVSQRENTLRGKGPSALNATKTHCLRGHPYDAENTYIAIRGQRQERHCRTCAHELYLKRYYP